jgi:anthranilate/para-aminobenzoate synthase component I
MLGNAMRAPRIGLRAGAASSTAAPVWRAQLQEPLLPEQAALRLAGEAGLAWLDGGLLHGREGRFSFVAAAPVELRQAFQGDEHPLGLLRDFSPRDALAAREAHSDENGAELCSGDVPHWIGHVAYDAHGCEQARFKHTRSRRLPIVSFARYDALYAYDHEAERAFLVGDDRQACEHLRARLAQPPRTPQQLEFCVADLDVTAAAQHAEAIRRALAHIRDGDVYEINLARRYHGRFQGSPLGLFLRMRRASPVPLGYFSEQAGVAVLGRSMERFLRLRARDRLLWTSPIKGTVARLGHDAAEAQALRSDAKEHAEHAMVVDLMRNDLGRVAEMGSVEIEQLMAVFPFAGLSHLVSTVRARARADLTLTDLLEHTFPPGSVTGTPKERALELIEALEDAPRGVYTGAVGFVDRAGGLSLAVAIRTALVCEEQVEYFAGGGIVWGSEPEREIAETDLKAQVFLRPARPLE